MLCEKRQFYRQHNANHYFHPYKLLIRSIKLNWLNFPRLILALRGFK